MSPYRTLLSVLLGLALLVQGFAVSAAPRATLSECAAAGISVMAETPCHAQKAGKADQQRACCDASCPDMTTCALGHLAAISAVSVFLSARSQGTSAFVPVPVLTRTLASPLRPPISLHG